MGALSLSYRLTPGAELAWGPDITHRLRTMLHAEPLFEMRRGEQQGDPAATHYDSLAIALRVLDLVITSAGFEAEFDRAGVRAALGPFLAAIDRVHGLDTDPVRHDGVVVWVLGKLQNDANGRQHFRYDYTDVDADGLVLDRTIEFRLLYDYHAADGRIVLRASNEAVNLYLNALDHDLADAHAAAEALVQSQIRRGRFQDALRSAKDARIRSVRFEAFVREALEKTKRDVRRVDWRDEMPRVLREALDHIALRIVVEGDIADAADAKLAALTPGSKEARQVAAVREIITECAGRHADLQNVLMVAPAVFLAAHGRQAFAPARSLANPDVPGRILEPILRASVRAALPAAREAIPLCHPPTAPAVFTLAELVAWQLRPRRELPPGLLEIEAREVERGATDLTVFTSVVRARVHALFAALASPTRLSAFIGQLVGGGEPRQVITCAVLTALHLFAPDGQVDLPIEATKVGERFTVADYAGDDLLLTPGAADAGGNVSNASNRGDEDDEDDAE